MADSDVLPYDYVTYAREVAGYIDASRKKAENLKMTTLDFGPAKAAGVRLTTAAEKARSRQMAPSGDLAGLNASLRQAETALLSQAGLPNRPWYRHTIFAPGEFTGYSAVVLPGVNEAIDAHETARALQQLDVLTEALQRAALALEAAH